MPGWICSTRGPQVEESTRDIRFNTSETAALTLFLRRTGLGFTRSLRDRVRTAQTELTEAADASEAEEDDWDVGTIAGMGLDPRI